MPQSGMATKSRIDIVEIGSLVERIEELEAAGRRVAIAHMYDHATLDASILDLAATLGMLGDG